MTRYRLALALAALLAASAAFAQAPDINKVSGSIDAVAGQTYGDLETVNGSIRIGAGTRTGDAGTVNGSIRADSRAHTGDLETVNGSITLGDNVRTDSLETVNGSISLGAGTIVAGRIETVNGGVFADRGSRIARGVATVNGAIGLVASEVGGNLETVNGDVTVGVNSHVKGGLTIEKPNPGWLPIVVLGKPRIPRIVIGPNARVDGALVFKRDVKLYVHASAKTGPISGATAVRYEGARPPRD